jgi:hypothetical protein
MLKKLYADYLAQNHITHPLNGAAPQEPAPHMSPNQQSAPTPYGQDFSGATVPPSSVSPAQQPQMAAKSFASPAVSNIYPANSAAKPSVQQPLVRTPMPLKPYSLAAGVAGVTQPRGGFMNPSQQGIPPAPGVSALPSGTSTKFLKPYVIDTSIPTRPQYGSAGAMYPAGFSSSPVPNCQAATSYPSQPANTGYPPAGV